MSALVGNTCPSVTCRNPSVPNRQSASSTLTRFPIPDARCKPVALCRNPGKNPLSDKADVFVKVTLFGLSTTVVCGSLVCLTGASCKNVISFVDCRRPRRITSSEPLSLTFRAMLTLNHRSDGAKTVPTCIDEYRLRSSGWERIKAKNWKQFASCNATSRDEWLVEVEASGAGGSIVEFDGIPVDKVDVAVIEWLADHGVVIKIINEESISGVLVAALSVDDVVLRFRMACEEVEASGPVVSLVDMLEFCSETVEEGVVDRGSSVVKPSE